VADLISKLRTLAADFANLCHFEITPDGVKGKFYRKIADWANVGLS
jgi:hypothetical protein